MGELQALICVARGVTDLEAKVPQHVQHHLGDAFAPRRLLIRQQEQQIDIGMRGQQTAPVTAGGDNRHPLGIRRVRRIINQRDGMLIQQPDQIIRKRR